MSTNYYSEAQALYLGLFNMVANPSGQVYWEGQLSSNPTGALNSIGSFATYDYGTSSAAPISNSNIANEIVNVYANLLGVTVAATDKGVMYWADQFNNGQSIGQIVSSIYNIVENISSSSPLYIDTETMNARVFAANSFTNDYSANVISPTYNANVISPSPTLSYAGAGNYITSTLTQSYINGNPTAPFTTYSSSGIQSTMTSTTSTPQFYAITATQTAYMASLTSSASDVVFVVNDSGSSQTVTANGTSYTSLTGYNGYVTGNLATTPPTGPSPFASASYAANGGVLSSSDSLNAAGGNGTLDIFAYPTTLGSQNFAPSYTGLLPSTMTDINTIIINGNAMDLNTSTGAAASVHNITISGAVNDALCEYITSASSPALSTFQYGGANHAQEVNVYTIASTQNFTYENTSASANINSTGTSANITLGALTQNSNSVSPTINIDGSTTTTLNLTSAGATANYLSLSTTTISNPGAPALIAAPLTTLNISGVLGNTLYISLMADNTNNAAANTPANTTITSLTTINASHDAGTLNLTTNTASDTITVGTATAATITTMAIYDTVATTTTTPENMTTITGATSSDLLSFAGDPTNISTFTFTPAAAGTGFNNLNSVGTNIINIITALQHTDASAIADTAVYFQEGGNTYIVNDSNAYTSSANTYTDQVVQLTGTITPTSITSASAVTHVVL